MTESILQLLEQSRRREKEQTLFYRALAALAEAQEESEAAERLNALLADEQHHLARLSARILELGGSPAELSLANPALPELEAWEGRAGEREAEEVGWYQGVLSEELDSTTRELFSDILVSEEHHARELGGKWMSA